MSADNWDCCPKCIRKQDEQKEKEKEMRDKKYGKVSAEKYLTLVHLANQPIKRQETLSEYYCFVVTEHMLAITYSCNCDKCGFKFQYRKNVSIIKDNE